MKEVRLQKYIADCGITSRRKAEDLIAQGRVTVNGDIIRLLGTKVDPAEDTVLVDGKIADLNAVNQLYVVLNKPRGYMTTLSDPEGRKTVLDLIPEISERVYPVGRLDYLSEGLLIMTNDGEVANMIMHPSFNITKVYEVKVFGSVSATLLKKLRTGVQLEDGFAKPLSVRVIKELPTKTWLEFRLGEGKNREIRKLCEACGLTVDKLKRVAVEGLTVDGIAPGSFRYISKHQLLKFLGLNPDGTKSGRKPEYFSSKKSITPSKLGLHGGTAADDETFVKFRKETYFDSLTKIKASKKEKVEKEIAEKFADKEAAFQERKRKKHFRAAKKKQNEKGVHAMIVKD